MRTLFCLLLAAPLFAADPEKPAVLKDDELAVLADPESPDRRTVMEKYHGKLLKMTGRIQYSPGGVSKAQFVTNPESYTLTIPGKKPKDPSLTIGVVWSGSPANKAIQDQIKRAKDKGVSGVTVYGTAEFTFTDLGKVVWFPKSLNHATTNPKTGGVPVEPAKKEPARLKDK